VRRLTAFLLLFLPIFVFPAAPDVQSAFDEAARTHDREFQTLLGTRGVKRETIPITAERLTAALSRYYAGKAVGVLFYSHENGILRIWSVGEGGIEAFEEKAITADDLAQIEKTLMDSLLVDTLSSSRRPRLRQVTTVTVAPMTHADPAEAIAAATRTLLPGSIARSLAGKKHLILVPVLNLGSIPFALLKPFGGETLLVERMSLSVAPSLSDAVNAIERNTVSFGHSQTAEFPIEKPLIVGNPHFAEDAEWVLPQLPGAEAEALHVADLLGCADPLIGDAATLQAIRSRAGDSDFLFFATHGVADAVDPLDKSFLAVTPNGENNGFWTAREIQHMRMNADMAVLSACQTGLGKVQNAGIIGLARAFQLAGVPHVVMSLWSVYDDATQELMGLFIRNLREGSDFFPADALRRAMLELRKTRPDPAEWAPFVVMGVPY
jgi:CHAT domain-containing protein